MRAHYETYSVGRDFTERTQAYLEIYDQQDSNRIDGAAKPCETTLGIGGRQTLNSKRNILLLWMGGRSFQRATSGKQ
jgi:hypothetical protein